MTLSASVSVHLQLSKHNFDSQNQSSQVLKVAIKAFPFSYNSVAAT